MPAEATIESWIRLEGNAAGKSTVWKALTWLFFGKTAAGLKAGDVANYRLSLRLIADVGLVGLPNAGKSSLLNELTNASSKVGSYQFTTLEPHLGALSGGFVLADIPGLIEGASEGKGLGIKFLRHIKRTRMLAHLVSLENENPMKAYKEIRKELGAYDKMLLDKKEVIILTKTDVMNDQKKLDKIKKEFEKLEEPVFTLSLYEDDSVKKLIDGLVKLLRK